MYKFKVTFKKENGNRSGKQYTPAGFEVEVQSNYPTAPSEGDVKRAVEQKLGTVFNYSCAPSLWESKKI